MDFALNDEQQMLQESARRFFSEKHPVARARLALPWSDPRQSQLWSDMAGMGWMALLAPETHEGLGLGLVEACLVAEAAGRQLLNLPWASSAVLLPLWVKGCGHPPDVVGEWLSAAMKGERSFHCVGESDGWVDHARQASDLIVVRNAHDDAAPLKLALFRDADRGLPGGLDPTIRQGPAAVAEGLEWQTLEMSPEARARVRAAHRLVLAAELVGTAQAALEIACGHARDRVQFGKAIGSYQAIKHQLANAWMSMDNAWLSTLYAAAALDGELSDWRFACAVAEFTAIEGALQTTRTAIQVHGGIGFTWEHDAHLFLKRVQHGTTRLGGVSRALERVEALDKEQFEGAAR